MEYALEHPGGVGVGGEGEAREEGVEDPGGRIAVDSLVYLVQSDKRLLQQQSGVD